MSETSPIAEFSKCRVCGMKFQGNPLNYYCSSKCRKEWRLKYHREYNEKYRGKDIEKFKKESIKRTVKSYTSRKEFFVKLKGNRCSACGNQYPLVCYDFHHIDPNNKTNRSGIKKYQTKALTRMKQKDIFKEIEKCVLLCANCHRITHMKHKENDKIN